MAGITRITRLLKKSALQPRFHQNAAGIQAYGTVNHLQPLDLEPPVRLEMTCPAQSAARRYYEAPSLVQEVALAGRGSDVLMALAKGARVL